MLDSTKTVQASLAIALGITQTVTKPPGSEQLFSAQSALLSVVSDFKSQSRSSRPRGASGCFTPLTGNCPSTHTERNWPLSKLI